LFGFFLAGSFEQCGSLSLSSCSTFISEFTLLAYNEESITGVFGCGDVEGSL
jgi:hypothetical protein